MGKYVNLAGRLLLGQIFLLAGLNKIPGYAGTQAYMESMGVPGALLPLVLLLEIGGGLAVILGWQARLASYALALFTLVAAVIFHSNFGDQMQMIMFMKNLAIVGGLLILAGNGAGGLSLDGRRRA
ncbi:MAG TPA: DoxX family protein [Chromatiales bacterium]|nr:DoxX family protein [Chromatiales bacterium]